MKKINDLLKSLHFHPRSYIKEGNVIVCSDCGRKVVVKHNQLNRHVMDYLKTRNFNYYPEILYDDDNYIITDYVESIDLDGDQKILDLINLVALLHNKTTHYKEVDEASYKELYEDIKNNILYLQEYYNDLINVIEMKHYMSPWEYLFARNVSQIFLAIKISEDLIEQWYQEVKFLHKMRVVVLHNNLSLDHFIKGSSDYLISWDKAKVGIPSFDLYKLYLHHSLDFSFVDILNVYQTNYPLKKEEKLLLLTLINLPLKLDIDGDDFTMCQKVGKEFDRLYKSIEILDIFKKDEKKTKKSL